MPNKLSWAKYVSDDGTVHAKLADQREIADTTRGWELLTTAIGMPLMPRGCRPRMVYGYSRTTGRRGHTIVATTTAALWDRSNPVQSFTVVALDLPEGLDTLQITHRVGERWRVPTVTPQA